MSEQPEAKKWRETTAYFSDGKYGPKINNPKPVEMIEKAAFEASQREVEELKADIFTYKEMYLEKNREIKILRENETHTKHCNEFEALNEENDRLDLEIKSLRADLAVAVEFISDLSPAWLPDNPRLERHAILRKLKSEVQGG